MSNIALSSSHAWTNTHTHTHTVMSFGPPHIKSHTHLSLTCDDIPHFSLPTRSTKQATVNMTALKLRSKRDLPQGHTRTPLPTTATRTTIAWRATACARGWREGWATLEMRRVCALLRLKRRRRMRSAAKSAADTRMRDRVRPTILPPRTHPITPRIVHPCLDLISSTHAHTLSQPLRFKPYTRKNRRVGGGLCSRGEAPADKTTFLSR